MQSVTKGAQFASINRKPELIPVFGIRAGFRLSGTNCLLLRVSAIRVERVTSKNPIQVPNKYNKFPKKTTGIPALGIPVLFSTNSSYSHLQIYL